MFVDVKTCMDRFSDLETGDVFLFANEPYIKTTLEGEIDNTVVGISLESGKPSTFVDEDLVIYINGTFVEDSETDSWEG